MFQPHRSHSRWPYQLLEPQKMKGSLGFYFLQVRQTIFQRRFRSPPAIPDPVETTNVKFTPSSPSPSRATTPSYTADAGKRPEILAGVRSKRFHHDHWSFEALFWLTSSTSATQQYLIGSPHHRRWPTIKPCHRLQSPLPVKAPKILGNHHHFLAGRHHSDHAAEMVRFPPISLWVVARAGCSHSCRCRSRKAAGVVPSLSGSIVPAHVIGSIFCPHLQSCPVALRTWSRSKFDRYHTPYPPW